MYGQSEKKYWEEIAGCELEPDQPLSAGSTLFVFATHPNTRGRRNSDWERLGSSSGTLELCDDCRCLGLVAIKDARDMQKHDVVELLDRACMGAGLDLERVTVLDLGGVHL
jgi:hypothetical protein